MINVTIQDLQGMTKLEVSRYVHIDECFNYCSSCTQEAIILKGLIFLLIVTIVIILYKEKIIRSFYGL